MRENSSRRWIESVLATPFRCHAICSTIAALLLIAIGWIWIHPEWLASDPNCPPELQQENVQLISMRDQLMNDYHRADQINKRQRANIRDIQAWLPERQPWDQIRSSVQSVAIQSHVQLVALDRGKTHAGTRVSVQEALCEVHGSYSHLCQFLKRLSELPSPFWCGEIRMVRKQDLARESSMGDATPRCLATLTIRVPFAGKGTIAKKLLNRIQEGDETTAAAIASL